MWQENVCESICCHLPKPSLFPKTTWILRKSTQQSGVGECPVAGRSTNTLVVVRNGVTGCNGGHKWCNGA